MPESSGNHPKGGERSGKFSYDLDSFGAEVDKARTAKEEYQRLKSTFITNISHEMRTPLNAILGFSELSQMEEVSLDEMREYMKIIHQSSGELLGTIKDVIHLASLDAGEVEVKNSVASVKGVFQNLDEYYTYYYTMPEDKNLRFKIKYPSEADVFFCVDEGKLVSVFKKLIDNGLRYTEKGTVELQFQMIHQGEIYFYLTDTGIGIPKDKIPLIFEPFHTVDESRSKKYGGSGLGLSIVKRLIDLMDGRLEIHSHVGKGTAISVIIPYRSPEHE